MYNYNCNHISQLVWATDLNEIFMSIRLHLHVTSYDHFALGYVHVHLSIRGLVASSQTTKQNMNTLSKSNSSWAVYEIASKKQAHLLSPLVTPC